MLDQQSENQENEMIEHKGGHALVKLYVPVKWDDDEPVSELEIKRPKGKHLKFLKGSPTFFDLMQIASKTSGYTPKFFDELDGADLVNITGVIGDFLDTGPKTGRTA